VRTLHFGGKPAARKAVWDALEEEKAARFPFPPHGRIPNFEGAREAAERMIEAPVFAKAKRIKANPDAPQAPLRALALERGIEVYMPTPRLRGGFKRLRPKAVPKDKIKEAVSLSHCDEWADAVALADLPAMDVIVAGSVAVTRRGDRCGKGEGYSDLEFAILRELGHPPCPVVSTVHPLQFVEFFPVYETDIPLSWIATPEELIAVENPGQPPRGIEWDRVTDEQLEEMPVLRELKARLKKRR
jgi:5-formyltetrahydrofolate cyclo-ligase